MGTASRTKRLRLDGSLRDAALVRPALVLEGGTMTAKPIDKDFRHDRLGTAGRITYMAHGKGYVMARHPGAIPFAIPEALWRSFPYWTAEPQEREPASEVARETSASDLAGAR